MIQLSSLVEAAFAAGASDLHLEPGLPPAFRVDGRLQIQAGPISSSALQSIAREAAGDSWDRFVRDRSLDLSRTFSGVRCRINVLRSRRGVGLAIRLLQPSVSSLDALNLHPSLTELSALPHGLVLVSGPTGSGKSSTIAALVQEINTSRAEHILTLEQPVEYWLRPQRSFIRQREVGRDTPTFEQGLLDALREDPDVIVVGEMRRQETMRLTLDAAETGHLVFTTVHASTVAESLHRIVSAFPAEAREGVQAQLAGALAAVVCQRLVWRPDLGMRVPECSILRTSEAARGSIRQGSLTQLPTILETGANHGSWTAERYRRWLDARPRFHKPTRTAPGPQPVEEEAPDLHTMSRTSTTATLRLPPRTAGRPKPSTASDGGVFVLDDAGDDPTSILSELLKS
jgi:twitching motility protein PilT